MERLLQRKIARRVARRALQLQSVPQNGQGTAPANDKDQGATKNADAAPSLSSEIHDIILQLERMILAILFKNDAGGAGVEILAGWMDYFRGLLEKAMSAATTSQSPGPQLPKAVDEAIVANAGDLKQLAADARTYTVQMINDSSLIKQGENKPPVVPTQAQVRKFSDAGAALSKLARNKALPASDVARAQLNDTCATIADAALAMLQALAVLQARESWTKGADTESKDSAKGKRSELDDIFQGAGWSDKVNHDENGRIYDWCGMFVDSSYFRGAGLAKELRGGFWHVDNVKDFFNYQQIHNDKRVPMAIWAEDQWWNLKEYHQARGSLRMWTPRATVKTALEGGGAVDIRPGDTCLIDHGGGDKPSHIVMVESYDAATHKLVTIEGNTFGIMADKDGKLSKTKNKKGDEFLKQGGTAHTATGLHVRDLDTLTGGSVPANPKDAPGDAYTEKKGSTVWGVGRPSLVDFEDGHGYAVHQVPAALKNMSPDQMRQLAAKKGKNTEEQKEAQQIKKAELK